ncbi:imelysin family protein [Sandaracinus amylolyticus]|uniref:imelysin family protein n=1 Tax=Sandaracinus amylolyticus TaxID=927083 RepID=UPI001F1F9075|nr:imelysin family protein [Sandaracinus amylolyticus]UJR79367.1 Iron-regulated protein A [Sandaracinus amylolyticus]
MNKLRSAAIVLVVALVATACVIISSNAGGVDRAPVLRDSAEIVIVPGYRALAAEAVTLRESLDTLCAAPDAESLEGARTAFRTTSRAWERTLPWAIGPIVDERIEGDIAFWPTRPTTIESSLASATTIDDAWVDGLGATAKGLPALEYLLFERDAVLEDARRCAYAAALGAHLARTTQRLVAAWEGGYTESFATAGRGSTAWRTQLDALSAMLTEMIASVQTTKMTKLGVPLGNEAGGVPQPSAVELPYAHVSIDAMIATLEGLRALWLVEGGEGLDEWVRERDPALADRVLVEIDAAIAALRAIPEPLSTYVQSGDLTAGETAFTALRALERTLATDVSGAIALSVMFTDNDGD